MGQGRRFLTFDQRWLGLGCRGPGGSLEQEDTVQGSRGQSPLLGRAAQKGLPKRSDAQRREFSGAGIRTEAPGKKLHESPVNFTRCPEASPGPRRPGTLRHPPSPGQRRPGSAREAREPLGAWGRCWGCGAAPLPSPPGGGPAGWGERARRTGFSCGPWGPWRAWWPVGLGALDSGCGATLPAGLACAARGAEATAG